MSTSTTGALSRRSGAPRGQRRLTPDPITAEHVRRLLLVLAADELRIARDVQDVDPPPLSIAQLLDHANTGLFCQSLACEVNDNVKLAEIEREVTAHVRRPRPRRRP